MGEVAPFAPPQRGDAGRRACSRSAAQRRKPRASAAGPSRSTPPAAPRRRDLARPLHQERHALAAFPVGALPPRRPALPPSRLKGSHGPLSLVKITMVSSVRPSRSSVATSSPTLQSISSMTSQSGRAGCPSNCSDVQRDVWHRVGDAEEERLVLACLDERDRCFGRATGQQPLVGSHSTTSSSTMNGSRSTCCPACGGSAPCRSSMDADVCRSPGRARCPGRCPRCHFEEATRRSRAQCVGDGDLVRAGRSRIAGRSRACASTPAWDSSRSTAPRATASTV